MPVNSDVSGLSVRFGSKAEVRKAGTGLSVVAKLWISPFANETYFHGMAGTELIVTAQNFIVSNHNRLLGASKRLPHGCSATNRSREAVERLCR